MAIKLDIHKAYGSVEWKFLLKVMNQMGFNAKWIQWIEQRISTVCYSVVINGSPSNSFRPSLGIRQRILSPLIFICWYLMRYLECLNKLCRANWFKAIKLQDIVPPLVTFCSLMTH